MESLHFTDEERERSEKLNKEINVHSRMGFLNAHNGLRRGSIHTIIGTAGGGKSTLIRTVIRDIIFNKSNAELNISVWLSEETSEEYKTQLMVGMPPSDDLKRGVIISEEEEPNEEFMYFIKQQELIRPDILIYDNMTTSRFYEGASVKDQAQIFRKIKELTKSINCATIIVAHTGAEITDNMDRLINMNDIRGSKTPVNGSEFFYILQRFEIADQSFFPTIRIMKHRNQDLIHGLYSLNYNKATRSFINDCALPFEKFKEAHANRRKL